MVVVVVQASRLTELEVMEVLEVVAVQRLLSGKVTPPQPHLLKEIMVAGVLPTTYLGQAQVVVVALVPPEETVQRL
jgi:hypothetical protein